jgi:hypothetical protein
LGPAPLQVCMPGSSAQADAGILETRNRASNSGRK